jgi:hypothetical protein
MGRYGTSGSDGDCIGSPAHNRYARRLRLRRTPEISPRRAVVGWRGSVGPNRTTTSPDLKRSPYRSVRRDDFTIGDFLCFCFEVDLRDRFPTALSAQINYAVQPRPQIFRVGGVRHAGNREMRPGRSPRPDARASAHWHPEKEK